MPVKTDWTDARNSACVLQAGWYRHVHVRCRARHKLRALLRRRTLLVKTRATLDNCLSGILKAFGRKAGRVAVGRLGNHVRELLEGEGVLKQTVQVVLCTRQELVERIDDLHRQVLLATKADPVGRRLMSVPGVGPLTAPAYRTAALDFSRFWKYSFLGAHFGLTPRRYASSETDRHGHITRCRDRMLRSLLWEAVTSRLTWVQRWNWLKRWGVQVAQRRGARRAQIAVPAVCR